MIRVKVVSELIWLIEKWTFYPRLKRFYLSEIKSEAPTIIDVGSNRGQSINFFLSFFPNARVHAFEPNKKLIEHLEKVFRANPNIFINQVGVSSISGEMTFHENILDETSTLEPVNQSSKYLKRKTKILARPNRGLIKDSYEIKVTTLSNYFEKEEVKRVDILKVDVEGHEIEVLEGLSLALERGIKPEIIQLEFHESDMFVNRVMKEDYSKFLNPHGYRLIRTIPHSFGNFEEVLFRLT